MTIFSPESATISGLPWGVASTAQLLRKITEHQLRKLVKRGDLLRMRRGWYAHPQTPDIVKLAVAVGGQLTGSMALKLQADCWLHPDATPTVLVPNTAWRPRLRAIKLKYPKVRVKFSRDVDPASPVKLPTDCLAQMPLEPRLHSVPAIDSALNKRCFTLRTCESRLLSSPGGSALLTWIDGRSESGLESIMRLVLRLRRQRVKSQVIVPSVGRVDLVVRNKFALECDGSSFHDGQINRSNDYIRDSRLVAAGLIPIRVSYAQVVHHLDATVERVIALVRGKRPL